LKTPDVSMEISSNTSSNGGLVEEIGPENYNLRGPFCGGGLIIFQPSILFL